MNKTHLIIGIAMFTVLSIMFLFSVRKKEGLTQSSVLKSLGISLFITVLSYGLYYFWFNIFSGKSSDNVFFGIVAIAIIVYSIYKAVRKRFNKS
jgi:hypothetical protein